MSRCLLIPNLPPWHCCLYCWCLELPVKTCAHSLDYTTEGHSVQRFCLVFCWRCLLCVWVQLRQFLAGMARSLADESASLTPVHSWPPSTTDTTSAVECSSTSSGCSLLLTVGTSKSLSVEGWRLSNIPAFMSTISLQHIYFPQRCR